MPPFSAEARRSQVEDHLATVEHVPHEAAEQALKHGEHEKKQMQNWLTSPELRSGADPESAKELDALMAEVDAAWDDFSAEVSAVKQTSPDTSDVDEGWDAPPVSHERPISHQEQSPIDLNDLERDLNEALYASSFSFDALEQCAALAQTNTEALERFTETMTDMLGRGTAERLLRDPEYRANLRELQKQLMGSPFEGGPAYLQEASIEKIIAVHEIFENNLDAFTSAIDLKSRIPPEAGSLAYNVRERLTDEPISILQIDGGPDKDGEWRDIRIAVGLSYGLTKSDGSPDQEGAQIYRVFRRIPEADAEGRVGTRLEVEHQLFELPSTLKGGGIAAEITRASLATYDAMNIDAITLHANIDQGGYAWASYGYGWDMKKTKKEDILAHIRGVRNGMIDRFTEAEVDMESTAVKTLIAKLDAAESNPLAVTPQFLASIGKDGPLLRCGASGKWYTEEAFQTALANKEESEEMKSMRGPIHAGKIGMMGSDWHGKIDLKPTGPQEGKNRKLLEQKISSVKK